LITGWHIDCVVVGASWVSVISNSVKESEICKYLRADIVILMTKIVV